MIRRLALALVLACGCLALGGTAAASSLPAGLLFGLECAKASGDSHSCEIGLSPRLDGGEAVAVSRDGRFVWAGGADGVLWVFRRGGLGRIGPTTCQDSGGDCPAANAIADLGSVDSLATSPDGRDVYALDVSSAGSGRLHVLHVLPDGRLGDRGCFDQGNTCGAGTSVPALANAGDLTVSGDGRNVYVAAGFGTDAVSVFDRAEDGSLTYQGCIGNTTAICGAGNTAAGLAGAHGVAVSPAGGYVYVASTGANFGGTADGTVAALTRNADGSLDEAGCIEEAGGPSTCAASGPGLVDPYALVVGTTAVYVASRDGFDGARSSVTRLARGGGGTLAWGSCFAFSGSSECPGAPALPGIQNAFDIVMSPDGKTVHVTALGGLSTDTGAVTSFRRASNGVLSPAGCVGQFNSPEGCSKSRVIESGGEAIAISSDGANVYAGTGSGLAVLGREAAPFCRDASVVVPGKAGAVPVPCFDLNGDSLGRFPVSGPAHGDLGSFDDAAGTVRYKPEPGYVGPDFLTFRATGGVLTSNLARLTIQVTNVRPRLTRLGMTRKRFRRGRKLPSVSRRRARVGTKIRFRLSEPARVTLSFERVVRGRFRRIRTRLRLSGDTGRNSVRFQGRLSRRKRLKRGRYRLTVVAKDKQGLRSKRRRVRFRLVR